VDLQVFKNSVKPLIPFSAGGSYELMYDMLFYTRLLKYVTPLQLKEVNPRFSKICSKAKLNELVNLKILSESNGIYRTNDFVVDVLKESGKNTKLLPKSVNGGGTINETNNTDVFIQALKLSDYAGLFYPDFGYLRPDALLIRVRDGIKFEFLEIEAQKPNWESYIATKKTNYEKLSRDIKVYNFCFNHADILGYKVKQENFKFAVVFVCSLKKDWGNGFIFKESLWKTREQVAQLF